MSEIEQLREELATTRAELEAYRERYQKALERARILELGILTGRKSERLRGDDEAQMSMQLLALLKEAKEDGASVVAVEDEPSDADDDETGDDDDGVVEGGRARGRGRARRALPEALPRVEIEVTPPEVQVEGLAAFRRIGEEVSEVVERRPASLVVVRIVRPKYARKDAGPATIACLLPSWPRSRVLELAPASWQKTLEQQETQQRLAANVFRAVALGEHPRAV